MKKVWKEIDYLHFWGKFSLTEIYKLPIKRREFFSKQTVNNVSLLFTGKGSNE